MVQNFLIINNIKHFSRNASLGAVFVERFNRTIRDLLKRPVFERGDAIWIGYLPTKTKNIKQQSSLFYQINTNTSFFEKE